MPVGVLAVDQAQKGAIGDGRRHVPQLRQPMQPQLAHARHVGLSYRRPDDDVGEQRQGALGKAATGR